MILSKMIPYQSVQGYTSAVVRNIIRNQVIPGDLTYKAKSQYAIVEEEEEV
jgi:hypothetical protein